MLKFLCPLLRRRGELETLNDKLINLVCAGKIDLLTAFVAKIFATHSA